jgi:hypothetical protein
MKNRKPPLLGRLHPVEMDDEILSVVRKSKEDALHTSHAAVLAFNVEKNNWDALHAGIATVFILVNRKQNTVRICAATDDKQACLRVCLVAAAVVLRCCMLVYMSRVWFVFDDSLSVLTAVVFLFRSQIAPRSARRSCWIRR